MSRQRILYLDVAKFVAIWLVCTGHTYMIIHTNDNNLRSWIYSFHMPLFMMISGYFSINAFQRPFKVLIASKVKQLLLPAVSIPVICVFILFLFKVDLTITVLKDQFIGGMWFLKTLFACYISVYILKLLPFPDFALCIGSVLLALLIPYGSILQFNWMLIFFWMGFFLRKYYQLYDKRKLYITCISLAFFLLLGHHQMADTFTPDFVFRYPKELVMSCLTGLSGSLSVWGIVSYIVSNTEIRGVTLIANVGKDTLGVYGLQHVLFYALLPQIIQIYISQETIPIVEYMAEPILGMLIVFGCYGLVLLLSKNRWLDLFLFGGQYYNRRRKDNHEDLSL